MGRLNQEDECNYELVIRERRQDVSTVKKILQNLFSSVGLVFLCVVIAFFGKNPTSVDVYLLSLTTFGNRRTVYKWLL